MTDGPTLYTGSIPHLYISQRTRPGSTWATDGGALIYSVIHREMPIMSDTYIADYAVEIYRKAGGKFPALLWDGNEGRFYTTDKTIMRMIPVDA